MPTYPIGFLNPKVRNLVGEWLFSGNANDTSGSGNNGTVTGATLTTDRNSTPDSAYLFDGVNDFITIGDVLDAKSTGMSISAWVNTTSISPTKRQEIIAKQVLSGDFEGWFFRLNNTFTGVVTFGIQTNTVNRLNIRTNQIITINTWTHVVITVDSNYNSAGSHIYVDGVDQTLVVISSNLITLPTSNADLIIGGGDAANLKFDGKLDDIRVYDKELTQAEVTALFNE